MAEYTDQEIVCADCHEKFVFEAGEQAFFAEKGFTPPKRCKPCRDIRKAKRDGGGPRSYAAPSHADDYRDEPATYGDVWKDDGDRKTRSRRRKRR